MPSSTHAPGVPEFFLPKPRRRLEPARDAKLISFCVHKVPTNLHHGAAVELTVKHVTESPTVQ